MELLIGAFALAGIGYLGLANVKRKANDSTIHIEIMAAVGCFHIVYTLLLKLQ